MSKNISSTEFDDVIYGIVLKLSQLSEHIINNYIYHENKSYLKSVIKNNFLDILVLDKINIPTANDFFISDKFTLKIKCISELENTYPDYFKLIHILSLIYRLIYILNKDKFNFNEFDYITYVYDKFVETNYMLDIKSEISEKLDKFVIANSNGVKIYSFSDEQYNYIKYMLKYIMVCSNKLNKIIQSDIWKNEYKYCNYDEFTYENIDNILFNNIKW